MIPFKVAHCINCGEQAQVTDFQGKPINGKPGTKLVYITLSDEGGVATRVGTVPLCKNCNPLQMNAQELISNLLANAESGLLESDPELKMYPIRGIEVVKTYEG